MILWLKRLIFNLYCFLWYELLCRKEMFTPQLCRMRVHHGIFWSIGFIGIVMFIAYHIFNCPSFWESVLSISVLIFLAWLDDHLVDTARRNKEFTEDLSH